MVSWARSFTEVSRSGSDNQETRSIEVFPQVQDVKFQDISYGADLIDLTAPFHDAMSLVPHILTRPENYAIWCRSMRIALLGKNKDMGNGLPYAQTAFHIWTDLKERFHKVTGSRIFVVYREINSLVQVSLTVSSYYTNLKELWEEQSVLVAILTCKCEVSKVYVDLIQQQCLLQFLMGLSESYGQGRSQILLMSPLPFVNQAYNMIMKDEM
ncbi:uncharacterized protein LOC129311474 [Prosopis cineraria]|uniref:uncharacterized protein LOC129311474 n=1 Tax=Prosopis cineraria TaxID=364024 RepID=UPI00240FE313|nr:uncharacterized protein LOC129311474 [Prosopis cineraria]